MNLNTNSNTLMKSIGEVGEFGYGGMVLGGGMKSVGINRLIIGEGRVHHAWGGDDGIWEELLGDDSIAFSSSELLG